MYPSSQCRRCDTIDRSRSDRRNPENIGADAERSVRWKLCSRGIDWLIFQGSSVRRLVYDPESMESSFDSKMNSADCWRWEHDMACGVTTDGQRVDASKTDVLLQAIRHEH